MILRMIGGVFLVLLPLVAMEWVVFRVALTALDREISGLAEEGGNARALIVQGNDEFARLSASINRLAGLRAADLGETQAESRATRARSSRRSAIRFSCMDIVRMECRRHFQYVNQAACDFLNRSREELLRMGPGQVG